MRSMVIVNPGASSVGEVEGGLAPALEPLGEVAVRETSRPGDAERFAREAGDSGIDLVLAAGGDGTLNEVVNGLAAGARRPRLGVLPLGTGNDFARTLGMPDTVAGCVAAIGAGTTRPLDLVRVLGPGLDRLFVNVSAGGFSDEVGEAMDPAMKQSWGPLAYLRAAIEKLPDRKAYHVDLLLDGVTEVKESVFNVVVANARFVAGGTEVAPYAEIDDGVADLVLVNACSLASLASLAPRVLAGNHLEDPEGRIVFRQARTIEVRSEPEMPFNVDGEPLGSPVRRFEVVPAALEVVVPPRPD